jgi:hypothetical protein
LIVLQNLADLEEIRGRCSEICPESSHVAYQAISIKAEVFSDAEEEEYPLPLTFPKIKTEPEVSCGSVRWISQKQGSLILRTSIEQTTYIRKRILFPKAEKYIHNMGQVEEAGTTYLHLPPPQSVHMPCSNHTESAVLLMLAFQP